MRYVNDLDMERKIERMADTIASSQDPDYWLNRLAQKVTTQRKSTVAYGASRELMGWEVVAIMEKLGLIENQKAADQGD